jgi:periplasmic divalent cation tolerance protein
MGDEPRIALTTAPDPETARRLAEELVSLRLAACVNLVPGATSVYRWKGEVRSEGEVLLVVKTTRGRIEELEARLSASHPYEVPELVVLTPAHVEAKYQAWLLSETSGA